MTAWIVILWRFAATDVRVKYDRAETRTSNIPPAAKAFADFNTPLQRTAEDAGISPLATVASRESLNPVSDRSLLKIFHRLIVRSWIGERVLDMLLHLATWSRALPDSL